MGRNASGVKGIALSPGDELVGMVVADENATLFTACENGYGKRTYFGPNDTSLDVGGPSDADSGDEADAEEESGDDTDDPAEHPLQ